MTEFLTFQRFDDQVVAEEFIRFLDENSILHEIEDDTVSYDATMGIEHLTKDIRVKLLQEDFSRVNELLLKKSTVTLEEIDKSYHLFEFSDEELMELVTKSDEWSAYDYSLAIAILKNRGRELKPEQISVLKSNRVQELSKPEKNTNGWIIAGYALALFFGFIGAFIGIHICTGKKILPNGTKVYAFSENNRKHGLAIAIIGVTVLTISLAVKIWREIN